MDILSQMLTGALIAASSILFTALINHAFRSRQLSNSMKAKLYYEAAGHIADHFSKFFYVLSALSLGTSEKRLADTDFDETKFDKSVRSALADFQSTWAHAKKATFILELLKRDSTVEMLTEFAKYYNSFNETITKNNCVFSAEELRVFADQAYDIRSKVVGTMKV